MIHKLSFHSRWNCTKIFKHLCTEVTLIWIYVSCTHEPGKSRDSQIPMRETTCSFFFIKFLFYNYFLNRRNSWLKNYGIINWNFTKPLHIKNGTLSHLMALIFWEMLSEATNKCLKITGFYNFDNCEQTFHSITLWKKNKKSPLDSSFKSQEISWMREKLQDFHKLTGNYQHNNIKIAGTHWIFLFVSNFLLDWLTFSTNSHDIFSIFIQMMQGQIKI